MRAIYAIAGVALLLGSAAPAENPIELATVTPPAPVSTQMRSIMIYLKPTEGMAEHPYPLRNEPYIVALDEVPRYRRGQRACDTVIQVCRPREDGTFLNPGSRTEPVSPQDLKKYCDPVEPADPSTCAAPPRGSFQ